MTEQMELFIVVRKGIYIQGVIGIYESKALAEIASIKAQGIERDTYHSFEVHKLELNALNSNFDYGFPTFLREPLSN